MGYGSKAKISPKVSDFFFKLFGFSIRMSIILPEVSASGLLRTQLHLLLTLIYFFFLSLIPDLLFNTLFSLKTVGKLLWHYFLCLPYLTILIKLRHPSLP